MPAAAVSFDTLRPLLLAEWPDLDREALDATAGDTDAIVNLVAQATDKPKVVIKLQVDDLVAAASDRRVRATAARIDEALRRLEERAGEVRDHVKRDLVPEAEQKVKENLLTSLLVALGLGLILGLLLGSRRGR